MEKISAVYKIVNMVTGDFYVGSSRNVKRRWKEHKLPSQHKKQSNNPLYKDMQKYGLDKFRFQILAPVMEEYLKHVEQEFIEMLKPTYNNNNAEGLDVERRKEYLRTLNYKRRRKEYLRNLNYKRRRNYKNKFCSYNGETITLSALCQRFIRAGINHPIQEAKKYLLES